MRLLQFIELDPLAKNAFRLKFSFAEFKELASEKISRPWNPGIGGLGNQDVVFFIRDQQVIAGVVHHQFSAAVGQRTAVEFFKESTATHDGVFQLDALDRLYRMSEHRTEGYPGAKADDEHLVAM